MKSIAQCPAYLTVDLLTAYKAQLFRLDAKVHQGPASEDQAQPGSHERVAAQQDGDGRVGGCPGEIAQPRIGDTLMEQQVRREAIGSGWPGALIRPLVRPWKNAPMCARSGMRKVSHRNITAWKA